MPQTWILYPLFVLVLLSMGVGIRMLQLRYRAVLKDGLSPAYFRLNQSDKPPSYMVQAEQHYTNLYETPMLFYAIVILIYVLNMTNPFTVIMAWAYIASRLLHAYVHMGKNWIMHRRNSFLASIATLVVLWSYVLISLVSR